MLQSNEAGKIGCSGRFKTAKRQFKTIFQTVRNADTHCRRPEKAAVQHTSRDASRSRNKAREARRRHAYLNTYTKVHTKWRRMVDRIYRCIKTG